MEVMRAMAILKDEKAQEATEYLAPTLTVVASVAARFGRRGVSKIG